MTGLNGLGNKNMKNILKISGIGSLAVLTLVTTQLCAATLEVFSPRGEIPPPPFHAPAPRVTDLEGKTIGLYWIGKAGGDNFWDGIEELLNEKYPNVKTVRYMGPFDLGEIQAGKIAKEVDTMFYGVGD